MKHIAKSKGTRKKAIAAPSKNAIVTKTIEKLYSRGEKHPMLPPHTQPGPKDPFAWVMTHPGNTLVFAAVCKRYGFDFRHEINRALKLHVPRMEKRPEGRKKYRERKERDFERSLAFMGPIVEEIIDREKGEAARFQFGGSNLLAKPISDADFLADAGIVDDGLSPI